MTNTFNGNDIGIGARVAIVSAETPSDEVRTPNSNG